MYHVITDNRFPYDVYGSQQDSGTAARPEPHRPRHDRRARLVFRRRRGERLHRHRSEGQQHPIRRRHRRQPVALRPADRAVAEHYAVADARRAVRWAASRLQKYRFPWTPPLVFSPIEPDALYYGAQVLLKTTDGGLTWKEISPDLTGDTRKDKTAAAGPVTPENARALGLRRDLCRSRPRRSRRA